MKRLITTATLLALTVPALANDFRLQSEAMKEGKPMPQEFAFNDFGCKGDNMSPPLNWSNAPQGTKSFAIAVHDPDAPTGGAGFWHWMAIDIPADVTSLPKGAGSKQKPKMPKEARQIANDYGNEGWGGPCPPEEDKPHRYNFTVYAIGKEALDVPKGASASLTGFMINQNALGSATFTATYDR